VVIQVVVYLFARKQGFVGITNRFIAKLTCVFHCSIHSCFLPSFSSPTAVCLTVVLLLQVRSESAMLASAYVASIPHFEHFSVMCLCKLFSQSYPDMFSKAGWVIMSNTSAARVREYSSHVH